MVPFCSHCCADRRLLELLLRLRLRVIRRRRLLASAKDTKDVVEKSFFLLGFLRRLIIRRGAGILPLRLGGRRVRRRIARRVGLVAAAEQVRHPGTGLRYVPASVQIAVLRRFTPADEIFLGALRAGRRWLAGRSADRPSPAGFPQADRNPECCDRPAGPLRAS